MRVFKQFSGVLVLSVVCVSPAVAIDEEHAAKARGMIGKAAACLRAAQDERTGGWSVPPEGSERPAFPAVTALVLTGLVGWEEGGDGAPIGAADPVVDRGVAYLLSFRQPDGGIYDRILPSYNTAIALSALSRIDTPEARAAVKPAQDFLRGLQWSEASDAALGGGEAARPTGRDHPFYGGIGYGKHGRPDLSNLSIMLEGLHDSGVPSEDPAFQRALAFLSRVQMLDEVNDMPYAEGSRQGGFIYATGENRDTIGTGQSMAGTVEETLDDGTNVSRLRAYGSMTYAGFKSLVYAKLPRDDGRVTAALGWIAAHYTLEENPGVGTDGLYYYLVTFARALDAWGEETIGARTPGGEVEERDWANDLIDRLAGLQNPDGSFRSLDDRWMENDPVLITAYALIALRHAAE